MLDGRTDWTPPWPAKVEATRQDLAVWFAHQGYTEGAEIGTNAGEYAVMLCAANPALHLRCIDPWIPYEGYHDQLQKRMNSLPKTYKRAKAHLRHCKATILRQFSADAVQDVPDRSLDFVFIDGNHAYDYVVQDHTLWAPKVKVGGIVAGHDYHHFTRSPHRHIRVIEAVNDYTSAHQIAPWWLLSDSTYYWRNP